ncbi:hypothetical protein K1719_033460 [Acacia pycnantha]|nr:hypothetical protein K1719_033460 [Acacia pycnantha]
MIGVWKNKWHILRDMKPFSLIKQEKIIIATITPHNFIRKFGVDDEEFDKCDLNPDYIFEGQEECDIDEEMNIKSLSIGKSIHGYALRSGFGSFVNVSTALVDMYFKFGSRDARLIFEGMNSKNVVSWNSMIDGYGQNGELEEAFATFLKMLDEGMEPTNVSIMGALHACADLNDLERGKFVYKLLNELKFNSNVSVMNSLISMYSKCNRVDIAATIFDGMQERTQVTWNAMLLGYAQNDLSVTRQAKWIHGLVSRTCLDRNVFVATALVDTGEEAESLERRREEYLRPPPTIITGIIFTTIVEITLSPSEVPQLSPPSSPSLHHHRRHLHHHHQNHAFTVGGTTIITTIFSSFPPSSASSYHLFVVVDGETL